jgi:NAD(P)-dependent dehydrogenase (short-subunit alcohol dehydrogenase family)
MAAIDYLQQIRRFTVKDRIVLVTGAGRGIGRSIAQAFAAAGARVAVTARTGSDLESLAAEIVSGGGAAESVLQIADDLTDRAAPDRILDRVRRQWGDVQVLVNNAGVGSSQDPKPLVDFDDGFWDFTFALNVTAPYLLTKRVLRPMIEAGWGRVINISSINAKVPGTHGAAYTASKHAVAGLTKAAAIEVAAHGVTVNAICPGVTATLMNDKRIEYDCQRLGKSFEEIEAAASPLGRRLVPDEVAPLAVFLAGDGAAAINGQLINVCGGTVMC